MPTNERDSLSHRSYRSFLRDVEQEVERAVAKHAPMNSAHEGYAVILEELDEFWEEVRRKQHNPEAMYVELTQVAAMAARCAIEVVAAPAMERAARAFDGERHVG